MRKWEGREADLKCVDLDAAFQYWREHQHLPWTKSRANAVVRPSASKTGPNPMFEELEIAVAEWVDQQTAHKMRVSRLSVIKQALVLNQIYMEE